MAGLIDITPISKEVEIRGVKIPVTGFSASALAEIMARFPKLRKTVDGGAVEIEDIMLAGADAVAAIIAAGVGKPGDKGEEKIAAALVFEDQFDLLEGILAASLPRSAGVGPFMGRLEALGILDPGAGEA